MPEPRVRVRCKVRVVAKNTLGALILLKLHQPTLLTDVDVERIVNLAMIELGIRGIGFAQGRHAEVDKRPLQASTAKTASPGRGLHINILKNCRRGHDLLALSVRLLGRSRRTC